MKGKRFLALCLSVIMLLSVFSIAAYAYDKNSLDDYIQSSEYVKWVYLSMKVQKSGITLKLDDSKRLGFKYQSEAGIPETDVSSVSQYNKYKANDEIIFTVANTVDVEVSGNFQGIKVPASPLDVTSAQLEFIGDCYNDPTLSANPDLSFDGCILKSNSVGNYTAVNYGYGLLCYDLQYSQEIVDAVKDRYPNAKIYNFTESFPESGLYAETEMTYIPVEVYANVYRLYNPNSGEHFFTVDKAERDMLSSLGWKYEGVAWYAPGKKENPVYRVYNPNAGDHHYTLDAAEKDWLVSLGWKDEGIAFYSPEQGGTAINRVYNPNAVAGSHFFTQNVDEYNNLDSIGWTAEGTAFYGYN